MIPKLAVFAFPRISLVTDGGSVLKILAAVAVWIAVQLPKNDHAGMTFLPRIFLDDPVTLRISSPTGCQVNRGADEHRAGCR